MTFLGWEQVLIVFNVFQSVPALYGDYEVSTFSKHSVTSSFFLHIEVDRISTILDLWIQLYVYVLWLLTRLGGHVWTAKLEYSLKEIYSKSQTLLRWSKQLTIFLLVFLTISLNPLMSGQFDITSFCTWGTFVHGLCPIRISAGFKYKHYALDNEVTM